MLAFDSIALFNKSKVYIDRALSYEHHSDLESFQLWCSLSLELLGKSVLSNIHPALVADPSNLPSLLAACGVGTTPERRSIAFKTVFERLPHVCKQFRNEDALFCLQMAARRNEELHSGNLPFVGMRETAWVPQFWKVSKALLEALNKTLEDWVSQIQANSANAWIASEKTATTVEGKLKQAQGRFIAAYVTIAEQEKIRSETSFNSTVYLPLFGRAVDSFQGQLCPSCRCEGAVGGEEWSQSVATNAVVGKPWMEVVDTDYISTEFRCLVCGLRLDGREELSLAQLEEHFTVTDIREPEYEADYGND